jgi:hypothetical protein
VGRTAKSRFKITWKGLKQHVGWPWMMRKSSMSFVTQAVVQVDKVTKCFVKSTSQTAIAS